MTSRNLPLRSKMMWGSALCCLAFLHLAAAPLVVPPMETPDAAHEQSVQPHSPQTAESPTPAPQANPTPSQALALASQIWPSNGVSYPSYEPFKDSVLLALRNAKSRILLLTTRISDGDVATALFSAKLRGLVVKVMLDPSGKSYFASRHTYLAQTPVETFFGKLNKLRMEGQSTLVIDDFAWRANVPFDEKTPSRIQIERSPYTSEEISTWFLLASNNPAKPALLHEKHANSPTAVRNNSFPSGTMRKSQRVNRPSSPRRGLPRTTRLQLIEEGRLSPQAEQEMRNSHPGAGSIKSGNPSWESDLPPGEN